MIDVIVIGQNYSTSLGVIKALAHGGYHCALARCIAGEDSLSPPDIKSRFTEEFVYLPRNNDSYVIEGLINKWGDSVRKRAIIPTDDYCASLIDTYYQSLSPYFVFPHSVNDKGILFYMNKEEQKKIIAESGILTSRCKHISLQNISVDKDLSGISFPCMVKPIKSLGALKSWIQCCKDIDDLLDLIKRIKNSKRCPSEILVEDYIEVESEYTIPCLALNDRVFIPAIIKKLNIAQGNHKGVTICGRVDNSESYASLRNVLIDAVKRFGVIGLLDIEVFSCKGKFYLNEINFRNGAAGYSLTCAGVNLPLHLVEYLFTGSYPDTTKWKVNSLSFVNDKANLESFSSHHLSFKQYINNIKQSDIRLVAEKDDMPAFLSYIKMVVLSFLKSIF